MTALLSLLQALAFLLVPVMLLNPPCTWKSLGETTLGEAGAEEAGGVQPLMLLVGDLPGNCGTVGEAQADTHGEEVTRACFLLGQAGKGVPEYATEEVGVQAC